MIWQCKRSDGIDAPACVERLPGRLERISRGFRRRSRCSHAELVDDELGTLNEDVVYGDGLENSGSVQLTGALASSWDSSSQAVRLLR